MKITDIKNMNRRKILALYSDTSGIDRYLFPNLEKRGWRIKQINIGYPHLYRYLHLATAFSPNIRKWKERFVNKTTYFLKSPEGFKKRTEFSQKKIKNNNGSFDIIFQVSGMFAPSFSCLSKKYVLFLDWTRKLSEREWPDWAPVEDNEKREEWFKLEQNTCRNAALIFTVSEYTKRSVINDYGITADKVVVTGYGPTLDSLPNPNFKKEYDGKTILFVGFDFKRKGGYVLLDAFKKVIKIIPDAKLIIVGPINLDINLPGVELKGSELNKAKIEDLYQQASVFAMPSLCEPFGLVFLEAMTHKLPCIGTNVDAMPEIIKNDKTGFLVNPHDSVDLAEKIVLLLKNHFLLKKMGEAGYSNLKENFTWDKTTEKIDLNLEKIINQKNDNTSKI